MGVPELSVLIPTYQRAPMLLACLGSLRGQVEGVDAEVVVALDGPDPETEAGLDRAEKDWGARLRWRVLEKRGYIPARIWLLDQARGAITVSLNDDVVPDGGFLEAHSGAHADGARVVSGVSRWKPIAGASVFDRMVQETDLIFFGAREDRAATYRDCYGLNMSFPTDLARRVGGFWAMEGLYGYDDIELAWRLERDAGAEIVRAAGATLEHDHRYTPEGVIGREFELGRAAWHIARLSPGFGRELFGELHCPRTLGFLRESVERGARDAERGREALLALGSTPGEGVPVEALRALTAGWVSLKRWLWRRGVLREAGMG